MASPKEVRELIEGAGGTVNDMTVLPDGHGFATASFPLPKDHWIYGDGAEFCGPPPMSFRMGTSDPRREAFAQAIREAGKYAVKASTMQGRDMDFDPDAMLQNLVVGMLGYWTKDALSNDEWANPDPIPPIFGRMEPDFNK